MALCDTAVTPFVPYEPSNLLELFRNQISCQLGFQRFHRALAYIFRVHAAPITCIHGAHVHMHTLRKKIVVKERKKIVKFTSLMIAGGKPWKMPGVSKERFSMRDYRLILNLSFSSNRFFRRTLH